VLSYKLPITEITVLLNGVVVAKQKPAALKYALDFSVNLNPGGNILTIIAANAKASSKLDTPEIKYEVSQTSAMPNLAVLAVGVSDYEHGALRFAESDAREFAEKINQQQGCLFQTIKTQVLLGKDASREGILQALNWLNKAAPLSSDVRMLYISGSTAKDSEGSFYFLSQEHSEDFELYDIKLDLLFYKLAEVRNPAILFLDSSYSGPSYGRAGSPQQMGLSQQGISEGPDNVVAFIGSTGDSASIESASWRHSAFTTALLEALSGKADRSEDRYVDVRELQRWLEQRVSDLTKGKQQPFYLSGSNSQTQPLFCYARP
jgi:uncharacterized caspase-like protein